RHGAMTVAWSMDKIGPLARSAEDCELVLNEIVGFDANDLTSHEFELTRSPRRPTLGVLPVDLGRFPATASAFAAAVDVFRRLGYPIKRASLPQRDLRSLFDTLFGAECAAA